MKKNFHVLLIDPSWSSGNVGPNMGYIFCFPRIASILKNNNIDVSVVEFLAKDAQSSDSYREFQRHEKGFVEKIKASAQGAELVIISTTSISYTYGNYGRALRIAKICREVSPESLIALGGSFITMLDLRADTRFQPFLDSKSVDVLIHGEGEEIVLTLCRASRERRLLKEIPNISYRSQRGSIIRNRRVFLDQKNLSDLPLIDWSLYDWNNLRRPFHLFAARGCLYNCSFCFENILSGRKYRFLNHQKVFSEIVNAYNLGLTKMSIEDSTFLAHPEWEALCDKIIESKMDIFWIAWATARDILRSKSRLNKLRRAGCKSIIFGIESASDSTNRATQSVFKVDTQIAPQAIKALHQNGIATQGTFVVGLPGETLKDIEATLRYGIELPLDYHRWHIYMPNWWTGAIHVSDKRGFSINDWKKVELDIPNQIVSEILEKAPAYSWCESHTLIRLLFSLKEASPRMKEIKLGNNSLAEIFELLRHYLPKNSNLFWNESELYLKPL